MKGGSLPADIQHFDEPCNGEDLLNRRGNVDQEETAPTGAKLLVQDHERAESFGSWEADAAQVEMKDGSAWLFEALLKASFVQHFMGDPEDGDFFWSSQNGGHRKTPL
jgi:hypothetical protein